MKNRYQEMFDEVRASDTLKQEVLRMQNQENGRRTRRRLPVSRSSDVKEIYLTSVLLPVS